MSATIALAPMVGCTDRHFRYLVRLLCPSITLYTEMITTGAILHGPARVLAYDPLEHPVVCQIAGRDAKSLALCAQKVEAAGYDGVNLNVGCPSVNVQRGGFGACLMKEPGLVAQCVDAIKHSVTIPVTVKTRLGVDHMDDYAFIKGFVRSIVDAGCDGVIIHARKAWLKGLNPRQNRQVPALNYEFVYQLKRDFPTLSVTINGGITSCAAIHAHLEKTDAVMIGRKAYQDPIWLQGLNALLGTQDHVNRGSTYPDLLQQYLPYIEKQLGQGVRLSSITRHLLGLFKGLPGANAWRRHLNSVHQQKCPGGEWLLDGLKHII